jgi:hypothetical protein
MKYLYLIAVSALVGVCLAVWLAAGLAALNVI